METDPRLSLSIIEDIDSAEISSPGNQALYMLILSRSLDKLHCALPSDSLLELSVNHFSRENDEFHTMMSHYYVGRSIFLSGNQPRAIESFSYALDIAREMNDPFWIGLCSRNLSDIYNDTYNGKEALDYAKESYDNFKLTGRKDFIHYAMTDYARALIRCCRYEEAVDILKNVLDSAKIYADEPLDIFTHRLLGTAFLGEDSISQAIESFNKVCGSPKANFLDSVLLGKAYVKNKNIEKARDILNKIEQKNDLHLWSLKYNYYKATGDYQKALLAFEKYDSISIEIFTEKANSSVTKSVISLYDYANKRRIVEAENQMLIRTQSLIISIGIILIISLVSYIIIHNKNLHIRKSEVIIEDQKEKLTEAETIAAEKENETMETRRLLQAQEAEYLESRKALENISSDLRNTKKSVRTLLSTHYSLIDDICRKYQEKSKLSGSFSVDTKDLEKFICGLKNNEKLLKDLEDFVNQHYDNIMSDLRMEIRRMKESDYRLVLFTILGFSHSSIAYLLDVSDVNKIYERKRRIKEKIYELNEEKRAKFLTIFDRQ